MKTRILMGSLIVGIFLGLMWVDHYFKTDIAFTALFIVAISLSLHEYFHMNRRRGVLTPVTLAYLVAIFLVAEWLLTNRFIPVNGFASPEAFGVLTLVFISLLYLLPMDESKYDVPAAFFGLSYICGLSFYIVKMRRLPDVGEQLVWAFIVTNKMTDIMAYFTGKLFGRSKLAPAVSPNKTVEGAIGGLLFGAAAGVGAFALFGLHNHFGWNIIIRGALAISLFAQLGDLIESAIKRANKVKDSGTILKESGGFFDLTDGIILSAPVAYFMFRV